MGSVSNLSASAENVAMGSLYSLPVARDRAKAIVRRPSASAAGHADTRKFAEKRGFSKENS